jgi:hypothetical protein
MLAFLIGLFIGTALGVIIAGLLRVAARSDDLAPPMCSGARNAHTVGEYHSASIPEEKLQAK